MASPNVKQLAELLGLRASDATLWRALLALGAKPAIERLAYYAYASYPQAGVSAVFRSGVESPHDFKPDEWRLIAFHLHDGSTAEYSRYLGTLPKALTFGVTRDEVLKAMGKPLKARTEAIRAEEGLGFPAYVLYDLGQYQLHFQFDDDSRLSMVTVQSFDAI